MSRGTLFDVLKNAVAHPLPWRQRLSMLMDVARGLLFLHNSGLVHGHLTSSCILVCLLCTLSLV
jgi:hypothetical protein